MSRDDKPSGGASEALRRGKARNPVDRFFKYVQVGGTLDACWLWIGWRQSDGYGRFRTGGRGSPCMQAHRFMFELWHDRNIKPGYEIDHICETRNCLNPLHLSEVTPEENKSKRYGRRRYVSLLSPEDEEELNIMLDAAA